MPMPTPPLSVTPLGVWRDVCVTRVLLGRMIRPVTQRACQTLLNS
jgi:hypothetical protein